MDTSIPSPRNPHRSATLRRGGRLWQLVGLTLAFLIAPAFIGRGTLRAQADGAGADPSELFLKAFTSVQQAETAEGDGKLKVALSKYRFAASLLEQINQGHPNWQPLILQYRARKTGEAITKLQQKISLQENAVAAAPNPAGTALPRGGGGNNIPAANLSIDDDPLPEADRPAGAVNPSRAVATNRSAGATNSPIPGVPIDEAPAAAAARADAQVGKATQEARSRIEKLNEELRDTRKQLEGAQKEKRRLQDQFDNSQDELKTAQKKLETTRKNRDEIEADLAVVQSRLKEAAAKNSEAANETRKELRKQLAVLKDKLEKAESTSNAAAKEKDTLAAKLAAAQKKNAAGTNGELPKEVTEKLEALKSENASLAQRLVVAEKTIVDLNAEASKKKEEAESVQLELAKLRDQLKSSTDKNDRSETEITQLRKQLEDSADRMKEGLPREEATRLAKENDLLRNISLRLLKDQARRSQARKLMGEELAKLEVQSKTLTEQLDLLGQPTVQLTDEERALFKDPLINISDGGDPSTMAASIVAVSSSRPTGAGSNPTDAASGAPPSTTDPAGGAPAAAPSPAPPPPVPAELIPLAQEAKDNLDHARYPEAEEAYNKLVARAPKSVYGLANLGVVLSRQGKLKSAETKLKKAIALAPNDPFSQATLGIVYYQMRRFDDALDCLTKAIQLDPKNASAHNYLGITSSQKGWPEAAVEELEKALALNPNYADAHFNLAVVYAINQPPAKDKAKQHYSKATQLGATPDPALEKLIN